MSRRGLWHFDMATASEVTVTNTIRESELKPLGRLLPSAGPVAGYRARLAASTRFAAAGVIVWLAAAGAGAQSCPAPGSASTPCSGSCAAISVGNAAGAPGNLVSIPISFQQGPDNGKTGQGFDDVAAIALTLGVPGTGDDPMPLAFDCTDGRLANGAVQPGAGIAANFAVVVENEQCVNRDRCLCPTSGGQTRDDFVNIVIYGPKDFPAQGPVEIASLPDSGQLLALNMRLAAGASGEIPLHVFSAIGQVKPEFGANLSIGDQAACDVTADSGADRSNITISDGKVTVTPVTPGAACPGDCNGDSKVTISELISAVNIALGSAQVGSCQAADQSGDGKVAINELIGAVNSALNGCPGS